MGRRGVNLIGGGGVHNLDALPGAITIPTTPGGEGNPNLSKGVAPAGGWQPATRLSIGQRPKNMYCPRVAKFCHQGLVQGAWARL